MGRDRPGLPRIALGDPPRKWRIALPACTKRTDRHARETPIYIILIKEEELPSPLKGCAEHPTELPILLEFYGGEGVRRAGCLRIYTWGVVFFCCAKEHPLDPRSWGPKKNGFLVTGHWPPAVAAWLAYGADKARLDLSSPPPATRFGTQTPTGWLRESGPRDDFRHCSRRVSAQ